MEDEIDQGALRIANNHTSPLQANMLGLEITQYLDRKVSIEIDKVLRHFYNGIKKMPKDYEEWKEGTLDLIEKGEKNETANN